MPYSALWSLQSYGKATGAIVDTKPTIEVSLSAKVRKRLALDTVGGNIQPYLKMTRALKQTVIVEAQGSVQLLLPKKRARMALDVSIGAVPSAFDNAQAVLNALASQYNIPGTIGAKINDAGSAGDPWSTDLSTGGYAGNQAGKKINDIKNDTNMIPGAL